MNFTPEVLYGIGAAALLATLAFATLQYKRRNRANDSISEQATRDIYDNSKKVYDREREDLNKHLHPS